LFKNQIKVYMQTSVTHRIRELDDALQGAFAGIQEQVKQLREAVEDLEDRSRAKSEDGLEAFTGQQSMVLKEETWVMNDGPDMGEEEAHNLSAAALSLQRSATSQLERDSTRHSHLRLNSHLMELSMKAEEAVEAIGKGRWASSRDIPKAATRSRTFSVDINDPAYCRVLLPDDKFRLAWDTAISFVIGFEICILPLCTAWGVTFSPGHAENAGSMAAFLQVFSAFTLVLWPLDIILDFNTGFYRKGHLRLKRSEIAQRYLSTWFAFDITMVVLDIAACITSEQDDSLSQVLRMLQMLRVLRILKIGKISVILENLVIATGNYSLILTLTVGKVVVSIATVAHILACIWYALGQSVSNSSERSWLDLAGIASLPPADQYVHAVAWILLMPNPPVLEPDSTMEHYACVLLFITVVLVIGSALSIVTGTLNEIRQVSSENSRRRRQLRIYLQTKGVPTGMTMRVMSYADYKLGWHSQLNFDNSLVSPRLEKELAFLQLGGQLQQHPVFDLAAQVFPEVFKEICRDLERMFFCEAEFVFSAGAFAENMYLTCTGKFAVNISNNNASPYVFADEFRYFAEVALYVEAAMHGYSLQTISFADVYALSSKSLCTILTNSPMCATMFVEYAMEFVATHNSVEDAGYVEDILEQEGTCAEHACHANSFYLELYVDGRKVLRNLDLSYLQEGLEMKLSSARTLKDESMDIIGPSPSMGPAALVNHILFHEEPIDGVLAKLQRSFVELDPDDGLHARFANVQANSEQERAESAIISLVALVRGDFESYTAPQDPKNRLEESQWEHLQTLLTWANPDAEQLLGVIFLLAVRGIGKYKALTRQLPTNYQRPEHAVRYILNHYPNCMPSIDSMSMQMLQMANNVLELQEFFNFAQMIQGENVPENLDRLQRYMQARQGEDLLKFYILFLLGFMSGLAGGHGSKFMTVHNAKSTILGLSILKRALEAPATPLYWTYIRYRGVQLGITPTKPADLALIRLACLLRARTPKDIEELDSAWNGLGSNDRLALTKHFLADGLTRKALVFEFLPLCLENAKANPFVTIRTFLEVLVDLIQAAKGAAPKKFMTFAVDLNDFSAFVLTVQNSYIFQTCLTRAKLRVAVGNRFSLEVTQDNWRRVTESQSDMINLASAIRELTRRQGATSSGQAAPAQTFVHCHF